MLVVMSHQATQEDVDRVCETIRAMGYTPAPDARARSARPSDSSATTGAWTTR